VTKIIEINLQISD